MCPNFAISKHDDMDIIALCYLNDFIIHHIYMNQY